MKRLVCIPLNGYFFSWRTGPYKNYISHYARHFSGLKPEVCHKPILDSRKQKNNFQKTFSSQNGSNISLMDYDVWYQPKILRTFKDIYYFAYKLKEVDESFSLPEFKRCSVKALQVVTTLLSKSRFSELEHLLTPECRKEIEKNLTVNWTKSQLSVLAVDPECVTVCVPCEVDIYSDKENKGKSFVEMRVIHYAWITYDSEFTDEYHNNIIKVTFFYVNPKPKLLMGVVFNCKFIKEITEGISSQWMISAINLKRLPPLFTTIRE